MSLVSYFGSSTDTCSAATSCPSGDRAVQTPPWATIDASPAAPNAASAEDSRVTVSPSSDVGATSSGSGLAVRVTPPPHADTATATRMTARRRPPLTTAVRAERDGAGAGAAGGSGARPRVRQRGVVRVAKARARHERGGAGRRSLSGREATGHGGGEVLGHGRVLVAQVAGEVTEQPPGHEPRELGVLVVVGDAVEVVERRRDGVTDAQVGGAVTQLGVGDDDPAGRSVRRSPAPAPTAADKLHRERQREPERRCYGGDGQDAAQPVPHDLEGLQRVGCLERYVDLEREVVARAHLRRAVLRLVGERRLRLGRHAEDRYPTETRELHLEPVGPVLRPVLDGSARERGASVEPVPDAGRDVGPPGEERLRGDDLERCGLRPPQQLHHARGVDVDRHTRPRGDDVLVEPRPEGSCSRSNGLVGAWPSRSTTSSGGVGA